MKSGYGSNSMTHSKGKRTSQICTIFPRKIAQFLWHVRQRKDQVTAVTGDQTNEVHRSYFGILQLQRPLFPCAGEVFWTKHSCSPPYLQNTNMSMYECTDTCKHAHTQTHTHTHTPTHTHTHTHTTTITTTTSTPRRVS